MLVAVLIFVIVVYVCFERANAPLESFFEVSSVGIKFSQLNSQFTEETPVSEWIEQAPIENDGVTLELQNEIKRLLRYVNSETNYDFHLIRVNGIDKHTSPLEVKLRAKISIHDPLRIFGSQAILTLAKKIRDTSYTFVNIRLVNTPKGYHGPQQYNDYVEKNYGTSSKSDKHLRGIHMPFDTPMENARSKYKYFSTLEHGLVSQEHVDDVMRDTKVEKPGYLCFGSANPEIETEYECVQSGGVWDKPVRTNDECPYYNEETGRGGMRLSGYCEMPQGVKQIGFRFIDEDPNRAPLCQCPNGENKRDCCISGSKDNDYVF